MGQRIRKSLFMAALLSTIVSAQASLTDLGNGIVYDDASHLDWLQNANLAATNTFGVSGINADGSMTWATAESWIAALNAADYLGHNDWRLPTNTPVNGHAFDVTFSYVGATDRGYNIGAPGTTYAGTQASEMSYLYYNSLANPELCSATGCKTFNLPALKTGLFSNVQSTYWSGAQDPSYLSEPFAFIFGSGGIPYGEQELASPSTLFNVWAVRSVTAVPEPATMFLLLAGLGAMGLARRRTTR